jgi:hypothetical protein
MLRHGDGPPFLKPQLKPLAFASVPRLDGRLGYGYLEASAETDQGGKSSDVGAEAAGSRDLLKHLSGQTAVQMDAPGLVRSYSIIQETPLTGDFRHQSGGRRDQDQLELEVTRAAIAVRNGERWRAVAGSEKDLKRFTGKLCLPADGSGIHQPLLVQLKEQGVRDFDDRCKANQLKKRTSLLMELESHACAIDGRFYVPSGAVCIGVQNGHDKTQAEQSECQRGAQYSEDRTNGLDGVRGTAH